jgi:riboflavin biosynthesis pyrimidine reductase
MQRNSYRKKGYKQRRRLPLTVTTRDSEHKGRGSRPLRIVKDKRANSPLMVPVVCTRRSLKLLVLLRKMERCKQSANICSVGNTKTADDKWFSKLPESIQVFTQEENITEEEEEEEEEAWIKKMKKMKTHDRRTTQDRSRKK